LSDHQGTVRDVVSYDSNQTTVENHLKYDSFGNITDQSDATQQPLYAFTGREWDADSELSYNRARWYDPTVGKFLSEDPIGFDGGDVNLARYVSNNPLNFTDPTGQKSYTPVSLVKTAAALTGFVPGSPIGGALLGVSLAASQFSTSNFDDGRSSANNSTFSFADNFKPIGSTKNNFFMGQDFLSDNERINQGASSNISSTWVQTIQAQSGNSNFLNQSFGLEGSSQGSVNLNNFSSIENWLLTQNFDGFDPGQPKSQISRPETRKEEGARRFKNGDTSLLTFTLLYSDKWNGGVDQYRIYHATKNREADRQVLRDILSFPERTLQAGQRKIVGFTSDAAQSLRESSFENIYGSYGITIGGISSRQVESTFDNFLINGFEFAGQSLGAAVNFPDTIENSIFGTYDRAVDAYDYGKTNNANSLAVQSTLTLNKFAGFESIADGLERKTIDGTRLNARQATQSLSQGFFTVSENAFMLAGAVKPLQSGFNSTKTYLNQFELRVNNSTLGSNFGNLSIARKTPARAYQSGPRMADSLLLRKNTNTSHAINITEWRRSISRNNIRAERLKFVGKDAVKVDAGTWRSVDGSRQFRTVPNDYLGRHGIGQPTVPNIPHAHFEFLAPPNLGGTNLRVLKNVHIPLVD